MLRYNGCEMGPCEVVIIGDLFGVRVTGTEPLGETVRRARARGTTWPSCCPPRSCSARSRCRPRSCGASAGTPSSASASPCRSRRTPSCGPPGCRSPAGKVVVIEEEMGIRITRVLARPFAEADIRASGFLLDPDTPPDGEGLRFPRPDKFTKIAIDNVHDTHCLFLRNLRVRLPGGGRRPGRRPVPSRSSTSAPSRNRSSGSRTAGRFGLFAAENLGTRRPDRDPAAGRFAARGKALLEEEGTRASRSRRRAGSSSTSWTNVRDYVNRQPVLIYHPGGNAGACGARAGRRPRGAALLPAGRVEEPRGPEPAADAGRRSVRREAVDSRPRHGDRRRRSTAPTGSRRW